MNAATGVTIAIYFQDNIVATFQVLYSPPSNDPNPKDWPIELSQIR
jgi:hypothetical protein